MELSKSKTNIPFTKEISVLFPEVSVVNGVIVSTSAEIPIPNICMKELCISTGIYTGLVHWATKNGELISNEVKNNNVQKEL